MKSNHKKLIIGFIIFIISIIFMVSYVQAFTFEADDYAPFDTTMVTGATRLESLANKIVGVIQVIGTIVSVIALIVIGIKYIMGSVEEKAEYKQTLKPYLIGAIMLFGITNILRIIQYTVLAL